MDVFGTSIDLALGAMGTQNGKEFRALNAQYIRVQKCKNHSHALGQSIACGV